ncbi:MAG: hypothetical protein NC244_07795 [Alistipes senegalensis]|nr:hypothetical protein [Alistipes senegalensis]
MLAVYCCVRCILYPGTRVIIASGSRGQALEVIEKIVTILMPNSENLQREIKDKSLAPANAFVAFHNTSYVKIITSNQYARHNRGNVIILDEYRMIDKHIVDTVIKKFLTSQREPPFTKKKEYANYPMEKNQQFYMSSCWFKNHWSWQLFQDYCVNMVDENKQYFVCGLPYQLAIAEKLLDRQYVEDEMSESAFDSISFGMEMGCLWYGENENAFFNYESLLKIRKIKQALYPREMYLNIDNRVIKYIEKVAGEIRILSADIAVMGSKRVRNDATAIFILQLIPTKDGQYIRNILYSENYEGGHTGEQALIIRKLFENLECDYIVIDTQGVGVGVYDNLVSDLVDEKTGTMYEALTCINDPDMAEHYKGNSKTPRKAIYSIKASAKFNSLCAFALKDSIIRGKMRLLMTEQDFRYEMSKNKQYQALSADDKNLLELPYVQTTLLVNELVNLEYTINGSDIKIKEQYDKRKDRYSSLSYGNYIANELERKIKIKRKQNLNDKIVFDMRKPQMYR